ncbi:hypothetical protein ACLBR5_19970 [Escherichia coli]
MWRRERDLTGWMSLSRKPEETWYGWDGDRLQRRYRPTPRVSRRYTSRGASRRSSASKQTTVKREKAQCRSLAEKMHGGKRRPKTVTVWCLPAELVGLLDRLRGKSGQTA